MKPLTHLLEGLHVVERTGPAEVEVRTITADSRQMVQGGLFVAVRGVSADGHSYILTATNAGAQVIVCEELPEELHHGVAYILVKDSAQALGLLAAAWHDHPTRQLTVVGTTGTNGKTTVTTLQYELFTALGFRCGLIGTVEVRIAGDVRPATHTTPDPLQLQALFAEMVAARCAYCFMEVSSHAIHQQRIAGTHFAGAVFTNITHDHLDYHGTFANYIRAKQQLFDQLGPAAFALTNTDDRNGRIVVQNHTGPVATFGTSGDPHYRATALEITLEGMRLRLRDSHLNDRELWVRLTGGFNVYNLLAVYASAIELGQEPEDVLLALSQLAPVRGRLETHRFGHGIVAVVDYAHTPDALLNVLATLEGIHRTGRIITLVGCGGDRDRTKRPKMAAIAAEHSDLAILTSDNPRTENPDAILDEMEAGVPAQFRRRVQRLANRREAIRMAAHLAQPGDVLLVAGKGHETYQEIMGVKHPFDDAQELQQAFSLFTA